MLRGTVRSSCSLKHVLFLNLVQCTSSLFVVVVFFFFAVRLSESVYTVKGVGECSPRVDELNLLVGPTDSSCLPSGFHETKKIKTIKKLQLRSSDRISDKCMDSALSGHTVYIDSNISGELWNKVIFHMFYTV